MWIIPVIIIVLVIVTTLVAVVISLSVKSMWKEGSLDYDKEEINQVGRAGENYVAKYLFGLANSYNGYLFNDFCFEDYNGYSTEIDHILITRGGVFIIETKTNKGTIYGGESDKLWVCIKKEYQDDKEFRNPIIQNRGHINHLRLIWGKNSSPEMISLIIFPIANISKVKANNVFNVNGAVKYIKAISEKPIYTQSKINQLNKRLSKIQEKFGITKEQHIKNIKKKYK